MADLPHGAAECEERRITAPNALRPGDAELETSTPPRDDEGKRRRLSSEVGSAAAGGSGTSGAEACSDEPMTRSSSGACSDASTSTRMSAEEEAEEEEEAEAEPLGQGVEDMLRAYLASWGQRLVQLQPKVYMTEHLIESGLYLFKYLRQLQLEAAYEGKFPAQYLLHEQLLIHDLVSCWWIALKHASVRTAVPNRTLMCRATGATPELLSDRELCALIAIDWEVQAVLKKGGLVQ